MTGLLAVQAVSTLFMVGVIWFVQIVHYPLMSKANGEGFPKYASEHARRTTRVLAIPLLTEGITAMLLPWYLSPGPLRNLSWLGLGLLAVVWASTAFLQVPCHRGLAGGFHPALHRRLVHTNWIRTMAWSARGILAVGMLAHAVR